MNPFFAIKDKPAFFFFDEQKIPCSITFKPFRVSEIGERYDMVSSIFLRAMYGSIYFNRIQRNFISLIDFK